MQDADVNSPAHPGMLSTLDAPSLPRFLQEAEEQIAGLGPEFEADRASFESLQARLREERCHLAVLGQFKRGKSTLVNALLGEAVLPSAVIPLTSIPTFLRGGDELRARVLFDNGRPEEICQATDAGELAAFLARFVTESANPHNRLGVRMVEAAHPAPLLRGGMALIDTPGIGSTFRHNTEATVNFLPQCDAALFVVSADPPITEVEVEFLKLARPRLARLFFILNKIDYLDLEERRAAVDFLQQVLCEQVGFSVPPPIFCASARQGLAARCNQDSAAWESSGLAQIEHRILEFLLTEKTGVLTQALSRQADDILADIQRRLRLMAQSLRLPQLELEERIRVFDNGLNDIEEQHIVALERLSRDEKRLADAIAQHEAKLLPQSVQFFQAVVRNCQQHEGKDWSEESAREAIAAAMPGYFEREFGAASQLAQQQIRATLAPYCSRADELTASVHRLVQTVFDVPFEPRQQDIVLAKPEQPYWRTHKWTISIGTVPDSWVDRVFPGRLRYARIKRRIMEQLHYLLTRNVSDLKWSILENLKMSMANFRASLDREFQQCIQATRQAIDTAGRRRRDSAAVAPEIARLEAVVASIQALRERLGHTQRA
jgi:GTP-binding protein EngB required for normal cell division